jgi:hypothetical protein
MVHGKIRFYCSEIRVFLFLLTISSLAFPDPISWAGQKMCAPGLIPDVLVYSELHEGEIGNKQYALVVEKSRQQIQVFDFQGRWRLVDTWPCSTGKLAGRKQKEGDYRTPEGVYFAVRRVPGRYLSDIYGAYALPLNYPNWEDRKDQRTGSAIWLHGTDKTLQERDTNGCVVLSNQNILTIASKVQLNQTPVIIVEHLEWWNQQEADQWAARLIELVERWQNDLMGGSYQKYKGWYAPGAAATMEWWHRWCRLRHSFSSKIGHGRIRMHNIDIFRFNNTFILQFEQILEADSRQTLVGIRRLYVRDTDSQPRIMGDVNFIQTDEAYVSGGDPLFAAFRELERQKGSTPKEEPESERNRES